MLIFINTQKEDLNVGEKLANKTLIGVERGLQRWATMFTSKQVIDQERFFVKYDAAQELVSMILIWLKDLNTRWNLRVLNLLVRQKAIRLSGLQTRLRIKSYKILGT